MAGRGPIAFLSDYGLVDEFVGVVHGVLARLAPGVVVVDVTHQVPPHDVDSGARTLWRAVPWLAPGVVLAVVDPGVGTARRPVAVEVGVAGLALVGPDNGLLLPAALAAGPISAAVELDMAAVTAAIGPGIATPGASPRRGVTFDGRDLFAPAAAVLAAGGDIGRLGTAIDPSSLAGGSLPSPRRTAGGLEGQVLWIDRFGNAQLNVTAADADPLGPRVTVRAGNPPGTFRAVRADAFAGLPLGWLGLVTDSYGLLALCADRAPAAAQLGLRVDDPVLLAADPRS